MAKKASLDAAKQQDLMLDIKVIEWFIMQPHVRDECEFKKWHIQ
jgi:hypothetical protein